jgi:hypothetical protein
MHSLESIQEFRQDAAFALRGSRRAPLFTAVALLTIAIGVGAKVTNGAATAD